MKRKWRGRRKKRRGRKKRREEEKKRRKEKEKVGKNYKHKKAPEKLSKKARKFKLDRVGPSKMWSKFEKVGAS